MIQRQDRTKHLLASLADVPAIAMRHPHDQAPHVQPLEQPAHRIALTTAVTDILAGPIQRRPDVGVVEAVQQVLTGE
jgi:hypothetical protein